jgi:TPR repeat protein
MEIAETLPGSPGLDLDAADDFARSPQAAYDYLSSVAFPHGLYPDTVQILDEVLDDVMQTVTKPLFAIADALEGADATRPMPEGIFRFISAVYQDAAQSGDARAAQGLGRLYYYPHYGHVNRSRAVLLFEQAAAGGVNGAFYMLGKSYLRGDGVPRDPARAFHLMTKRALVIQDCGCCMLLGDMYDQGLYVDPDPETAAALYDRAWDICSQQDDTLLAGDILLRLGRSRLATPPEKADGDGAWRAAQFYYQQAELYLYDQRDLQFDDAAGKLMEARRGQLAARAKIEDFHAQRRDEAGSLS